VNEGLESDCSHEAKMVSKALDATSKTLAERQ
jgi:hypothetical protein